METSSGRNETPPPPPIYIQYIIINISNPSRQHSKVLCNWGVRRGDRKTWNKETGGNHPGWNHFTRGMEYWMQRTQGVGNLKGWEDNRDCKHRYIHVKQE